MLLVESQGESVLNVMEPFIEVVNSHLNTKTVKARKEKVLTLAVINEGFDSTIEQEDYVMGSLIQEAAESGELDKVVFGRNEPALHHYHNNFRDALGMDPLAEHRPAG